MSESMKSALEMSDQEYEDALRKLVKDSAHIHHDQSVADSIERLKGNQQAPSPASALTMSEAEWESAKRNLR